MMVDRSPSSLPLWANLAAYSLERARLARDGTESSHGGGSAHDCLSTAQQRVDCSSSNFNGPAVQRSIQIFRKIWSERGSQARTSPQKCRYTPGYASATDHAPPFVDLASTSQGLRSGMSVFGLKWYQVVEGLLSIPSSRSNQNRSCPVNAFDDP